jgi:integrase
LTDRELKKVLNFIDAPNEKAKDEVIEIILRASAESITLERLKKISFDRDRTKTMEEEGQKYLKFTKKEISTMPNDLQRLFAIDEQIVTYRIIFGKYYQARYRRDGLNISVASKDFSVMKQKFIAKLRQAIEEKKNIKYPRFDDFVAEWLRIKKQTVKASTYRCYVLISNAHLIPNFGKMRINEITRKAVQNYLFELVDAGKNRTAHKLKQLLSNMFIMIGDDYDLKNPVNKVVLSPYVVKKGRAFTKAEEKRIVEFCKKNPHYRENSAILLLLYTGMRVGELKTMEFDGEYVTCISEKTRKGRKEIVRKIPISPMLKKILHMIDFEKATHTNRDVARDTIKRIFPDRHTHELRYTFITRAKECGVNPEVVMLWVGHEHDQDVRTSKVDRGYTTYSEEYLLSEILKIDYEYEQKC